MQSPQLYQQLLGLFDLSDELIQRIDNGDTDIRGYFITLVSIERAFDTYGRGLVRQSAREAGKTEEEASALSKQANERMDELRRAIRRLVQVNDFDDLLKQAGEQMYKDWHKLPDDHPNITAERHLLS